MRAASALRDVACGFAWGSAAAVGRRGGAWACWRPGVTCCHWHALPQCISVRSALTRGRLRLHFRLASCGRLCFGRQHELGTRGAARLDVRPAAGKPASQHRGLRGACGHLTETGGMAQVKKCAGMRTESHRCQVHKAAATRGGRSPCTCRCALVGALPLSHRQLYDALLRALCHLSFVRRQLVLAPQPAASHVCRRRVAGGCRFARCGRPGGAAGGQRRIDAAACGCHLLLHLLLSRAWPCRLGRGVRRHCDLLHRLYRLIHLLLRSLCLLQRQGGGGCVAAQRRGAPASGGGGARTHRLSM